MHLALGKSDKRTNQVARKGNINPLSELERGRLILQGKELLRMAGARELRKRSHGELII